MVDYYDSFSPVAKAVTVKFFLTIGASNGWPLEHMDINNAFFTLKIKGRSIHDTS